MELLGWLLIVVCFVLVMLPPKRDPAIWPKEWTVKPCTRPFPHQCRVNGPCNGWPRE